MNATRIVALAVAGLVLVAAESAEAQYRIENQNRALDANNRIGSGGFNSGRPAFYTVTPDQIVTGNVTGLSYFHGPTAARASGQFRDGNVGRRPSDELIRRSAGVPQAYAAPDTVPGGTRPFYSYQSTVTPPAGYTLNRYTNTFQPMQGYTLGRADVQYNVPPGTRIIPPGASPDILYGTNPFPYGLGTGAPRDLPAAAYQDPVMAARLGNAGAYLDDRAPVDVVAARRLREEMLSNLVPGQQTAGGAGRAGLVDPSAASDQRTASPGGAIDGRIIAQPIGGQAGSAAVGALPGNAGLGDAGLGVAGVGAAPGAVAGAPGISLAGTLERRNSQLAQLRQLQLNQVQPQSAGPRFGVTSRRVDELPGAETEPAETGPRLGMSNRRVDGTPITPDSPPGLPGLTPPGSTAPGSTPPGSTAPGSTVPGSTAPGSTAPGSSAPGSSSPGSLTPGLGASGIGTGLGSTGSSTGAGRPVGAPFRGSAVPTPSGQGEAGVTSSPARAIEPIAIDSLAAGQTASGLRKLLESAEEFTKRGRYRQALDRYNTARVVAPDDMTILLGQAHTELAGGYYARADGSIRAAMSTDPALIGARFDLRQVIGAERLTEVGNDLKQLALDQKDSPMPLFLLAYINYHTGEADRAVQLLQAAQERGASDKLLGDLIANWSNVTGRSAAPTPGTSAAEAPAAETPASTTTPDAKPAAPGLADPSAKPVDESK